MDRTKRRTIAIVASLSPAMALAGYFVIRVMLKSFADLKEEIYWRWKDREEERRERELERMEERRQRELERMEDTAARAGE